MKYNYLSKEIKLHNLEEGEKINRLELLEKLYFFKKYSNQKGFYITDKRYKEYGQIGLHYYKFDTIIKYLKKFNDEFIEIKFSKNYKLSTDI